MKVICSLPLFAPCLSALMISCFEYFLINVKSRVFRVFSTYSFVRTIAFHVISHKSLKPYKNAVFSTSFTALSCVTWLYTSFVILDDLCPMRYCKTFKFIPFSTFLVHPVWRRICGVRCSILYLASLL